MFEPHFRSGVPAHVGTKSLHGNWVTPISHGAVWLCQNAYFLFLPNTIFSCQSNLNATAIVTRVQASTTRSGQRMPSNLTAFCTVTHLQQLGFGLFSQCSLLEQLFHSDYAALSVSSSALTATEEIRKYFRAAVAMSGLSVRSCLLE